MADAAGAPVLPREAIAFLRAKGLEPSKHWLEVFRTEHACAFTVAQMTQGDMLRQTHRGLLRAMRRGETLETFRDRLQPWLEEKGWRPKGRGGNLPKRLDRIYHTNLRAAAAAGHWDRIQRRKTVLPWLIYELGPSEKHREDHAAWAGTCLRVDDPWWKSHYPPNGWGCKCLVRQVAKPPSGARTTAPPDEMLPWKNPHTRETIEVPKGIDPGWDYNAAEHAVAGMAQALTKRLQDLAPRLGETGVRHETAARLVRGFVRRYVEGPAFARFVERDRAAAPKRRHHRIDYGLHDKGAPVALLAPELQKEIGASAPVVVLTDWGAGKHYWKHGPGRQALQHERRRHFDVEVPVAWYAEIQALVDSVSPDGVLGRRGETRWVFDRNDGRRLVLWIRGGVAQVLTYHRAGEPRSRKKG